MERKLPRITKQTNREEKIIEKKEKIMEREKKGRETSPLRR